MTVPSLKLYRKCINIRQHQYYKCECNTNKYLLHVKAVNIVGHWDQDRCIQCHFRTSHSHEKALGGVVGLHEGGAHVSRDWLPN
jgi:hypothetical protein